MSPKPITRRCIICGTKGTRHFYTFPTSKDRSKLWLKSCGIEKVRPHDKLCWKHFKSDDFFPRRSDNSYRCLKRNVVPSINLQISSETNKKKILGLCKGNLDENLI